MSDCALTVMHAHNGRRLAKLVHRNGRIAPYDDAYHYDAAEFPVRNLDHLADILLSLLPCWSHCVVRGSLIGGSPASGIRRLLHPKDDAAPTLYEIPRRWVAIDVDGDIFERPDGMLASDIEGCARLAIARLPGEFHGRACIAVATGSHGFKPGVRLRLWFWLDGAATRKVLQAWFMDCVGIDLATFRPVQPIYTAAPVLAPGVIDPAPERLVRLPGAPLVPIRSLPVIVPRASGSSRPAPAGGAGDGDGDQADEPVRTGRDENGNSSSPVPASGHRSDRYRDAALAGIESDLMRASEGQRHHQLVASATRLFELGSLSDGWIRSHIRDAARMLNGRGTRQIEADEVDELLDWASYRPAAGPRGDGAARTARDAA